MAILFSLSLLLLGKKQTKSQRRVNARGHISHHNRFFIIIIVIFRHLYFIVLHNLVAFNLMTEGHTIVPEIHSNTFTVEQIHRNVLCIVGKIKSLQLAVVQWIRFVIYCDHFGGIKCFFAYLIKNNSILWQTFPEFVCNLYLC